MTTDDRHPLPGAPDDPLLRRYQEANALDGARPPAALRDAVLAQARAAATQMQRPAANDRTWTWRALGSVAVFGLVGLLVLQFDRGTGEEREIALGASPAARSTAPPSAAVSPPPAAEAPAPRQPAAPPPSVASPPPPREAPAVAMRERAAVPRAPLLREAPAPAPFPAAPSGATQDAAAPASPVRPAPTAGAAAMGRAVESERAAAPSAKAADAAVTAPSAEAAFRGNMSPQPAHRAEQVQPTPGTAAAALLNAAARGDLAAVRDALANGAEVNSTDARGRTALMLAAERGDRAVVRMLLGGGADARRTDRQGLTAADLARSADHMEILPLLEAPQVR